MNLSNYSNVPADCECAEFRAEGKRGVVTLHFEDANRALEWMNTPPQEHESLSAFVEKVEDSGEDKRQTYLGTLEALKDRFDQCIGLGLTAEEAYDSCYREMVDGALEEGADHYTQAQRDAYAAEAVKQERERLRERWAGFAEEYRGDAIQALWIANAIRKDKP